ncbi:hypothetical protein INR49_027850 [Caranx melampygus]|nr:hypothetical protein INR49_027850 [Caranx melampygus]
MVEQTQTLQVSCQRGARLPERKWIVVDHICIFMRDTMDVGFAFDVLGGWRKEQMERKRFSSCNVPPDLAICCFILEQSLSVRALQEMLSNTSVDESSQGGGHRTLLYGHAILLKHTHSSMYLCCLTTSRSLTDKLAFDVGLQEDSTGYVLRLFHGHMDECLAIPGADQGDDQRRVAHYEGGAVCSHARSLWRLEPLRIGWSGSHIKWGQSFRIRHITTGRYLCLDEEKGLLLVDPEKAVSKMSAFCFRVSKRSRCTEWEKQICQSTISANGYSGAVPAGSHFLLPPPEEELEHEEKQFKLRSLKNRQNLFQEEGMITLVLDCVDRLNVYNTAAHFSEYAGEEAADSWKEIVLDVLCSLCVCNGVAVRSNQNLITENLLPGRDLLLQTNIINYVTSMRPNIFLGTCEGSTQYKKWYFEVMVDQVEPFLTAQPYHLRVGWALTEGYSPYPGGGEGWGGNGVGDDLYSYGFDGLHLWSGRVPRHVAAPNQHVLAAEDVVSCCLDLSVPSISFRINGHPVQGMFENFNLDGLFFPVVSFSAGIKLRFLLGGRHGHFKFLPPPGYAPCYEAVLPRDRLRIEPIKEYKHDFDGIRNLLGPTQSLSHTAFTPCPVDTIQSNGYKPAPLDLNHVKLTPNQNTLVERLAENGHNVWARDRVRQGWTYSIVQDIMNKRNPRLVPYNLLDEKTKKTNRDTVCAAVRTLIGYGYNIEPPDQESSGHGPGSSRGDKIRVFRAEKCYGVTQGKWYFEFEAVTVGEMRVGWARPSVRADTELGADELAYVFNGFKAQRWHVGTEPFGRQWQSGDVVGCMIDLTEMNIMFTLNGEMLISDSGSEMAFKDIEIGEVEFHETFKVPAGTTLLTRALTIPEDEVVEVDPDSDFEILKKSASRKEQEEEKKEPSVPKEIPAIKNGENEKDASTEKSKKKGFLFKAKRQH